MFEKLEILRMAGAMAAHAANRQGTISQNVANADTPGYKALDVASFADTYRAPPGFVAKATRPQHFTSGSLQPQAVPEPTFEPGRQSPNGNTVSVEGEMMKGVQVRQQYDTALAIYKSAGNIVRASLGRR